MVSVGSDSLDEEEGLEEDEAQLDDDEEEEAEDAAGANMRHVVEGGEDFLSSMEVEASADVDGSSAPGIEWRALKPPRNPETLRARAREPKVLEGVHSENLNLPNHASVVGIVVPGQVSRSVVRLLPPPVAPLLVADISSEAGEQFSVSVDALTGERSISQRPAGGGAAGGGGGGGVDGVMDALTGGRPEDRDDALQRAFTVVRAGRIEELRDILVTGLVDLNQDRDHAGNSLLIVAAQNGNKRVIKELLRKGADPNTRNDKGNTALHYLFAYKHRELGEYLIDKGADDTLTNNDGLTPYEGLTPDDADKI
jgi:hypothetical protein